MNLKLLEKLVRLATNNPNEHEATVAAKRACKLILDGGFKFVEDTQPIKTGPVASPNTKVYSNPVSDDWVADMFRKSNYYRTYSNPFREGAWDAKTEKTRTERTKPFTAPFTYRSNNPDNEAYFKRRKERGFGNEKRKLTCKTCGNTKETIYQGLDSLFECNECQWTAWQKEKK